MYQAMWCLRTGVIYKTRAPQVAVMAANADTCSLHSAVDTKV